MDDVNVRLVHGSHHSHFRVDPLRDSTEDPRHFHSTTRPRHWWAKGKNRLFILNQAYNQEKTHNINKHANRAKSPEYEYDHIYDHSIGD